ncbi:MAG: hypothetical protein KAG53_07290 [Endozoicomonadaceae bacterium]|nr:hypothetical protein [Endozoicomonadaceae bacterium]
MLLDQIEAFNSLFVDQPIKLDGIDQNGECQTIKLTTRLLCFNFGVSRGAISSSLSWILGGWDVSDSLNQKGLEELIGEPNNTIVSPGGWVDECLKKNEYLIEAMKLSKANADENESQDIDRNIVEMRQKCKLIR